MGPLSSQPEPSEDPLADLIEVTLAEIRSAEPEVSAERAARMLATRAALIDGFAEFLTRNSARIRSLEKYATHFSGEQAVLSFENNAFGNCSFSIYPRFGLAVVYSLKGQADEQLPGGLERGLRIFGVGGKNLYRDGKIDDSCADLLASWDIDANEFLRGLNRSFDYRYGQALEDLQKRRAVPAK